MELLVKAFCTMQALQNLAEHHRSCFNIPVIGIVGSNGKTLVKEWLYQLLAPDFTVTRSPRSYNSQIGVPLSVWGPQLETHPDFPRKTNVEFVEIVDDKTVRMRVWERGAGVTKACGTGACATAVACILNGKTAKQVTVRLDGGDLLIEWPNQEEIFMTGPATEVFAGEYKGYL